MEAARRASAAEAEAARRTAQAEAETMRAIFATEEVLLTKEAEHARSEGRKALIEHDAAKLARREERLITALNAAVDYYAFGHELFESWMMQGATDAKAVDAQLTGKPETQQLEYLRHQIDMRVIGLGWN